MLINNAYEMSSSLESYLAGSAKALSEDLPSGKVLQCFKVFARRFIYTHDAAQRIEIAGSRIVEGLLDHFGKLLKLPRKEFAYFVERNELRKDSGLDLEWRIYNQLSKRMLRTYRYLLRNARRDQAEWVCRARLIVDHISGMTDNSARDVYQNLSGSSV
jgi:dGTPase